MPCYENVRFVINKLTLKTNIFLEPPIVLGFDYFCITADSSLIYMYTLPPSRINGNKFKKYALKFIFC